MQRSKDMRLEELTMVREHENACHKLKHQLELGLKRDKVTEVTVQCPLDITFAQLSSPWLPS